MGQDNSGEPSYKRWCLAGVCLPDRSIREAHSPLACSTKASLFVLRLTLQDKQHGIAAPLLCLQLGWARQVRLVRQVNLQRVAFEGVNTREGFAHHLLIRP